MVILDIGSNFEGYATVLAGVLIFLSIEYKFQGEVRPKDVWLKRVEDALTIVVITLLVISISLHTFGIDVESK